MTSEKREKKTESMFTSQETANEASVEHSIIFYSCTLHSNEKYGLGYDRLWKPLHFSILKLLNFCTSGERKSKPQARMVSTTRTFL